MKNLLFSLFVVLFLTSCGGSGPSACDCAEMSMEALKEAFKDPNISEEEGEKLGQKWEKKLKPCEEKSNESTEFRKELEKCLQEKMMGE